MAAVLFLLALLQCFAGADKTSAIYVSSNNAGGNQIYIYGVNLTTGTPTYLETVDTQGNGNGSPHSQGSLVTCGNFLLAANGGSNSISLFWINPKNATNVTYLDTTAVVGNFPTTIAATSAWGNLACVVTTFGNLTLSCYNFDQTGFTSQPSWTRDLGVDWTDATKWPTSQVSFSPKNTFLVIQFKGLSMAALVFPIKNNMLAATPKVIPAQPPLGPASYGFVFLSENIIVTTDGAWGIILYKIGQDGSLASGNNTILPNGSTAYCWMAYSGLTQRPYAIAAGTANVTEITVDSNNNDKLGWAASPFVASDAPLTDGVVIAGTGKDWLYVLSKNGVSVWPITGKGGLTYTETVAYPSSGGPSPTLGGLAGVVYTDSGASSTKATLLILMLAILSVLVNF